MSPKVAKECLVKRAAFDIGSGTTKLVIGKINRCEGELLEIIHEENRAVGFKQDLINNKNRFSKTIQKKGLRALFELKNKAMDFGVLQFSGAATSAFRKSKNGIETLRQYSRELGIELNIIDQSSEARLGYFGVKARLGGEPRGILVWDIGGGSMQLSYQNEAGLVIHRGNLASVSFKEEVLKIKKSRNKSPNPMGNSIAQKAVEKSRTHANKTLPSGIKSLGKRLKIVGIGGVHYYSIKGQTKTENLFTEDDVRKALVERANFDDQKVGGKYAETDVTNLALVLGYMNALQIKEVYPLKVNMGHGMLIDPSFWL